MVVGALLLAVLLTWPTMADPTRTIPQDTGDPTLQAWQVAWGGHVLWTDPTAVWHSNTFFPERYTYAYSDTLLGYAPSGLFGTGPVAAVLRYNILYVLAHALAFVGAYALVRQLGAGRAGAAVAGAAFGFAPWRLAQAGHLHVLSTGGIALTLAMLARGHGWSLRYGHRPDRVRPGWALAGWVVAAWQITLGFGIGLPFGYVLGMVSLAVLVRHGWSWWRRRSRPTVPGRLLVADLVGGALFAAVTVFMALPYLAVVARNPAGRRTLAQIELFSPPLRGFVTAPAESWLWGDRHTTARSLLAFPGEMTLLPGMVLIGLAFAGLFFSVWRVRHRLLLAAGALLSVALAMGTRFADGGSPGYVTLVNHVPGWDGIRTPGRLVLWTTLLLGLLAAGALSVRPSGTPVGAPPGPLPELAPSDRDPAGEQSPQRGRYLTRLLLVVPLVLVLLEGANRTPHPVVPVEPAALHRAAGPVLVLPGGDTRDLWVMLWSTDGFPQVVNGYASFTPDSQARTLAAVATFPDAGSVTFLRNLGIRTVVLLPDWTVDTNWANAADRPVDGLPLRREQVGDAIVFHLE